jgi:hypothetical protein
MEQEWLKNLEKIEPVQKYTVDGVTFLIYKAKNLHNPKWNSALLKKITKEARRSYLRYGRMSLLDNYDKNAEIYICRAIDSVSEEWISLRFVPGQTGADLLEDLSQYICNGQPVSIMIKQKLLPRDKNFKKKLVAISRICGIPPYTVSISESKITNLPIRLKHLAKSFALINKVFFSRTEFVYLLGVFRAELLGKLLQFDNYLTLRLPSAYKLLGCKPRQIRLNRNLLAYHFPGYFLNITQLMDLLEKLIKQGKLNFDSVKIFLKFYEPNFKESLRGKKYVEVLRVIQGLDKLLCTRGMIPKSKLKGSELRSLVMSQVTDGPTLKIMPVDKWKRELNKIKI